MHKTNEPVDSGRIGGSPQEHAIAAPQALFHGPDHGAQGNGG
jgi:hypothetical protein